MAVLGNRGCPGPGRTPLWVPVSRGRGRGVGRRVVASSGDAPPSRAPRWNAVVPGPCFMVQPRRQGSSRCVRESALLGECHCRRLLGNGPMDGIESTGGFSSADLHPRCADADARPPVRLDHGTAARTCAYQLPCLQGRFVVMVALPVRGSPRSAVRSGSLRRLQLCSHTIVPRNGALICQLQGVEPSCVSRSCRRVAGIGPTVL